MLDSFAASAGAARSAQQQLVCLCVCVCVCVCYVSVLGACVRVCARLCFPVCVYDCLRMSASVPDRQRSVSSYFCRWRPYRVECTGSLPNSEVKRRRARLVLGWGTAREDLRVPPAFFSFPLGRARAWFSSVTWIGHSLSLGAEHGSGVPRFFVRAVLWSLCGRRR